MTTDSPPRTSRITRRSMLAAVTGTATMGLVGCLGDDGTSNPSRTDEFIITTAVRDDPDDVARAWDPLADWIEASTGTSTRIDPVQDSSAAVAALATGQADAGYLSGGPAWIGWQQHGIEPIVAETDEDGNTHYVAAAWTTVDSGIETVEDLAGVDSCHTGNLTGAGMLLPMAHLAHRGLVSFDREDDITAIREAVDAFFDNAIVGGGYIGALQCLSLGHGEVGFMRKSTPETYCGGDDPEPWCRPMDDYVLLAELAEVPSHPFVVSPHLHDDDRDDLREALLSLNTDEDGVAIITDVLGVHALSETTGEDHLHEYGQLIEILPGIDDHLLG